MSRTVILDQPERDRLMINHINEILRHCRIGRVEAKPRPVPFTPAWDFVPAPLPQSGGYVPHLHPHWTVL